MTNTIKDEVANFYRKNNEECYSPKMVSNLLNRKYNTVKTYTYKLWKEKILKRIEKGLYQWNGRLTPKQIEGMLAEKDPVFHALECIIERGRGTPRISLERPFQDPLLNLGLSNIHRQCTWNLCDANTFQISFSCTKNPFTILELAVILTWLIVKFPDPFRIYVINFEVNKDLAGITLKGVKCIEIRVFLNWLLRVYEKTHGILRFEAKLSGNKLIGYLDPQDALQVILSMYVKPIVEERNERKPVPMIGK